MRDRYDGFRRNPWDEFECGHHYARALASWSLLLALSGWCYSAPEQALGFAPRVSQEDFRCFFSTGSAWGTFSQTCDYAGYRASVTIGWGELSLRTLKLPIGQDRQVKVTVDDEAVPARVVNTTVSFDRLQVLRSGQRVKVEPA